MLKKWLMSVGMLIGVAGVTRASDSEAAPLKADARRFWVDAIEFGRSGSEHVLTASAASTSAQFPLRDLGSQQSSPYFQFPPQTTRSFAIPILAHENPSGTITPQKERILLVANATVAPGSQLAPDVEDSANTTPQHHDSNDQLFPEEPVQALDLPTDQIWRVDAGVEAEGPRADAERAAETEATELKLRSPDSSWDLAELDSPLFGTEEISEFTRQINARGLWNVRPHFSATTLYDGNVFIQDKNTKKDFILTLSPGIAVRLGNGQTGFYLTADYTASVVLFLNNSSQDSLDHRASMSLQWTGGKLRVGLLAGLTADSGTSIDATDRVRRIAIYTGITSHYDYSEKISFDLNADYRPIKYQSLLDSSETRLQGYVNYNFTPKLTIGLGGVLGFATVERGADQTFEDASVRAVYVATGKLTFTADAGVETRQFSNGGDNTVNPVFGLAGTWAVREGTTVSINTRRRIFASAIFQEQDYADTGVFAQVTQRMTDRFDLSLAAGYDHLNYTAAGPGVSASRQDNFFFVRPSIQWHATGWCGVGVFYEYSQNFSSGEGNRDFRRDRTGLQVSIIY